MPAGIQPAQKRSSKSCSACPPTPTATSAFSPRRPHGLQVLPCSACSTSLRPRPLNSPTATALSARAASAAALWSMTSAAERLMSRSSRWAKPSTQSKLQMEFRRSAAMTSTKSSPSRCSNLSPHRWRKASSSSRLNATGSSRSAAKRRNRSIPTRAKSPSISTAYALTGAGAAHPRRRLPYSEGAAGRSSSRPAPLSTICSRPRHSTLRTRCPHVTGGAAELPALVAHILRESFGRKVRRSAYMRSASAIGLAIRAAALADGTQDQVVDQFNRNFGIWRETNHGGTIFFDMIFPRGEQLHAPGEEPLRVERIYHPAHNIGHFRYLESSQLDEHGQPKGEIANWDQILFPFDPQLRQHKDLTSLPVVLFDNPGALKIREEPPAIQLEAYESRFTPSPAASRASSRSPNACEGPPSIPCSLLPVPCFSHSSPTALANE